MSIQETICSQPALPKERTSHIPQAGPTLEMQEGQWARTSTDWDMENMPCAQVLGREWGGGIHRTANTKRLSPPLLGRQMPSPLGLAVTLRSETQLEHTMSSSSSRCSFCQVSELEPYQVGFFLFGDDFLQGSVGRSKWSLSTDVEQLNHGRITPTQTLANLLAPLLAF